MNSKVFNPFTDKTRCHFPSFVEAFGDLLAQEHASMSQMHTEQTNQSSDESITDDCFYFPQTPIKFPIVLPSTPDSAESEFDAEEERRCNDFFEKHVPVLTPPRRRAHPIILYRDTFDMNDSLVQSEADSESEDESETATANASTDSSMVYAKDAVNMKDVASAWIDKTNYMQNVLDNEWDCEEGFVDADGNPLNQRELQSLFQCFNVC